MDLASIIAQLIRDGSFALVTANPFAQFGPNDRYLGATILPEREVFERAYTETSIRYKTIVAADGSRYSPAQRREGGALVGTMKVELGDQDIAREFSGRDMDALLRLVGRGADLEAAAQIIDWSDTALNRALIEVTEIQRWQALVAGQVERVGDNGYRETVTYPNPAGHRAAAAGSWSNLAYDPFADIYAIVDLLASKGYRVSRIVTSSGVIRILSNNPKVAARTGTLRVENGAVVTSGGRATVAGINALLGADGLPPFEVYDRQYRDLAGLKRFMPANCMCFFAQTGQDATVAVEDTQRVLPDTLGYTAIGRAVGQGEPGRVIQVTPHTNKPPRLVGEAWQTSLPVITEVEAFAVVTGIN